MAYQQCSRGTPAPGQDAWGPGAAEIARLEAALPAALAAQRPGEDWSAFPQNWRRQYVGIVRDGRRYVYGNFYPRSVDDHAADSGRWRREPMLVCDGGPAFFGAEYDIEAGRISHLAFNGMI